MYVFCMSGLHICCGCFSPFPFLLMRSASNISRAMLTSAMTPPNVVTVSVPHSTHPLQGRIPHVSSICLLLKRLSLCVNPSTCAFVRRKEGSGTVFLYSPPPPSCSSIAPTFLSFLTADPPPTPLWGLCEICNSPCCTCQLHQWHLKVTKDSSKEIET